MRGAVIKVTKLVHWICLARCFGSRMMHGDGRRETGDERRETGDGRQPTATVTATAKPIQTQSKLARIKPAGASRD